MGSAPNHRPCSWLRFFQRFRMDRNTRKLELCALFRDWYEDNIGNKPSDDGDLCPVGNVINKQPRDNQ